jgi:pyruvate,water dikinase
VVLDFEGIDRTLVARVGGKAAHLGELSRIHGIQVPAGFCVTTDAFRHALASAPSIDERLAELSRLDPDDREAIRTRSAELRLTIEGLVIPDDLAAAVSQALARIDARAAYAVRSSATAEDQPAASFAGQHDSFLDIGGPAAILEHVSRCWASLFTERAVTYRLRNGFDHRNVLMAVVVQRMVFPDAAGVLFTADPVTSDRKVAAVEAVLGLGGALVAGLESPDVYRVRDGSIVAKEVDAQQDGPALTDSQVVELVQLGRRIEAHFACPQDIEWCLVDNGFQIVQSRPITTLFPIPEVDDQANHVYISVGHQQMMTDPMKPLGLSFWQLTTPRPMHEAGGRLFVDVAGQLASPGSRASLLDLVGKSDPLIRDALETVLARDDFVASLPDTGPGDPLPGAAPAVIEADPAVVADLIERTQQSIAAAAREIRTKSGPALFDFILADLEELKRILFDPQGLQVIMAAMQATWWLNDQLHEWLGERNAADTLTQSVPHNVTSAMGLELLDVADVIRPHPAVVAFLHDARDDSFLDELPALEGGREAHAAICAYLAAYGMRCVGEIDITRPRWSEHPTTLLPLLISNVANFEPGEGERRFEHGRLEAREKEQEVLARLRALPHGERRADETKRMIDRLRTFIGYREYPKYGMVSRYFLYKQALLDEAERLVEDGVLREAEDIFFLRFHELHDVARTKRVDHGLVRSRKEAFRSYRALTPPRVLTSDGETISGTYRRDALPSGALVGLPVSTGTVEGRARVILDLAEAVLEPGDILVTEHTDPSWSPLFVSVVGLVTEVGGLMTHGAVVAREYGLPAVVGVERATQLIEDGQRIRVNGTDGYIEVLESSSPSRRRPADTGGEGGGFEHR